MDSFAMFLHADEAPEPFEPTAEDFIEGCCECGRDLDAEGVCAWCEDADAADREPSDDFPMYLEYEGAYGLSGYDSFYDTCDY